MNAHLAARDLMKRGDEAALEQFYRIPVIGNEMRELVFTHSTPTQVALSPGEPQNVLRTLGLIFRTFLESVVWCCRQSPNSTIFQNVSRNTFL